MNKCTIIYFIFCLQNTVFLFLEIGCLPNNRRECLLFDQTDSITQSDNDMIMLLTIICHVYI